MSSNQGLISLHRQTSKSRADLLETKEKRTFVLKYLLNTLREPIYSSVRSSMWKRHSRLMDFRNINKSGTGFLLNERVFRCRALWVGNRRQTSQTVRKVKEQAGGRCRLYLLQDDIDSVHFTVDEVALLLSPVHFLNDAPELLGVRDAAHRPRCNLPVVCHRSLHNGLKNGKSWQENNHFYISSHSRAS